MCGISVENFWDSLCDAVNYCAFFGTDRSENEASSAERQNMGFSANSGKLQIDAQN